MKSGNVLYCGVNVCLCVIIFCAKLLQVLNTPKECRPGGVKMKSIGQLYWDAARKLKDGEVKIPVLVATMLLRTIVELNVSRNINRISVLVATMMLCTVAALNVSPNINRIWAVSYRQSAETLCVDPAVSVPPNPVEKQLIAQRGEISTDDG